MGSVEREAYREAIASQIKRVLIENGGNVGLSASILQMRQPRLSQVLNSNKYLKNWWRKFKDDKKKANKRARNARSYARREQRLADSPAPEVVRANRFGF